MNETLSTPCAPPVPNRTRIKICGLTRAQDVDAAVDAGADAVGFVLWNGSARAVSVECAAALAARLPPFVTPVLLFVNEAPVTVRAALARVPGALAQFHGDETPAQCLEASGGGAYRFLRAARIPPGAAGAGFDLLKFTHDFSAAQAILLDADVQGYGGSGKGFDWSLLLRAENTRANACLVLSGGLNAANVGAGIRLLRPRCRALAVDVSSGVESAKGIKDSGKMREFTAAVRAADASV
ncbi:MAG: phosphoribosylanthranilate isomerase [Burkholderiaceae bacterium]|jgi:phosphoribosylanthranilate isomerase|nr:phosphoribosylanthranilate isomerase [Burkholderiaceae bacterium]